MAGDDLFTWLDAIWKKETPHGTFPTFIAHRFLASQRDFANVARVLGNDIKEPAMVFSTWQALLPDGAGAPRLTYPAPKKRPEAEQLTVRMMATLCVRRQVAEEMQELVQLAGKLPQLYREYGVEPPDGDDDEQPDDERPKRKKVQEPTGLMAMIK